MTTTFFFNENKKNVNFFLYLSVCLRLFVHREKGLVLFYLKIVWSISKLFINFYKRLKFKSISSQSSVSNREDGSKERENTRHLNRS